MLLSAMLFIVGLFLLAYGSDRLVFSAAVLSRMLGISPLVIGGGYYRARHFAARDYPVFFSFAAGITRVSGRTCARVEYHQCLADLRHCTRFTSPLASFSTVKT